MSEGIKKIIDDHEKRIRELEIKLESGEKPVTAKPLSLKEFILKKKPIYDVQRTLVIGYFLERHNQFLSFNAKDLEDSFRAAKEPVPANINDKANKNVKNGHMMETKEKKDNMKAWVLTSSGERVVENGFEKE